MYSLCHGKEITVAKPLTPHLTRLQRFSATKYR